MNTPMLFCIGNHESFPTGQTSLFEDNIQPLATRQGYLITLDTITDKCYYYKDFESKKIRVIAINYYEDGIYDGHLGQDQIDWFCATLQSTLRRTRLLPGTDMTNSCSRHPNMVTPINPMVSTSETDRS